ncbi:hypothetical protein PTKIN_Ptkin09bG0269300 [Pterospermum kingtungense]
MKKKVAKARVLLQGLNEQESGEQTSSEPLAKRTKLTSDVWEEFTKNEDRGGKICAICIHCNRKFDGSCKKGTTHLRNHLERCQSRAPKLGDQQLPLRRCDSKVDSAHESSPDPAKTSNSATRDTNEIYSMFDQERSRLDFAKMIIKHQYPLDMVEQGFFKTFVKNLQPKFEFQSQASILSDIHRIYVEEKEKLHQYFDQLACNFNLTISLWKDNLGNNAYCSLMAHFIDDDWKLKKKILAFKRVEHIYDTGALAGIIGSSISEWNLGSKVCSITVDDSSLDDDIVQQIKENCLSNKGSLFSSHCFIGCTLIIDGFREIYDILFKLRKSIEYVTQTAHGNLKFQQAANQAKLQGWKSKDDLSLRMDSDFGILDSALKSREIFCQLEKIDSSFGVNPSMEEWDKALALHSCSKDFHDILSSLQGTQSRTSNLYLPKVCDIYKKFLQVEKSNYPFVTSMKGKFDYYCSLCNLVFAVAAVLDPRLKDKFVEFSFNEIYGLRSLMQLSRFYKVLIDVYTKYANNPRNMITSVSAFGEFSRSAIQSAEIAEVSSLDSFRKFLSASDFNKVATLKSDLDCYLEEPLLPIDGEFFDILGWWRVNSERFPTLGRMARDLLAMPMLVAAPCSDFSAMIMNPAYNGLNPEDMEALISSQNWLEMPEANDTANHVPLKRRAKRNMEEKETNVLKSCTNSNYGETSGGDKSTAKMMGTLLLKNVQQERMPLNSSEPNHGRDICGLIKISNGAPSFDSQSESDCSSSEFDGEIAWKKQGAWCGEEVRAYLVSSFTEKEKKRLNRWQNGVTNGKFIGRDKMLRVVDYNLRSLLIVPHSVETRADYYVHYSNYLIKGSRSKDEILSWYKKENLEGKQKLFLPLCLSAHWILFSVDTKEQKFSWFDSNTSTRMSNNVEKEAILCWFRRFLLPFLGYKNAHEWPFELRTDIPVQHNRVDSGLFVMKYADCLTHGDFFPFTQEDMAHFRLRTFLDIYRSRLHSPK